MDRAELRRWHNMMLVAFADMEMNADEKAYLDKVQGELGLEDGAARDIAEKARRGGKGLDLGGGAVEQRAILKDVICVALADGTISDGQRHIIETVAHSIGLTDPELAALIDVCRAWKVQADKVSSTE